MNTRRRTRGYPVSLLIGFAPNETTVWEVFSNLIKLRDTLVVKRDRSNQKVLYDHYEAIISAVKTHFKEGTRSVILVAPAKTDYSKRFLDHIGKHHSYMLQPNTDNTITFTQTQGLANRPHELAQLIKTLRFQQSLEEATSKEANSIIRQFEKAIAHEQPSSLAYFSLEEIEKTIYERPNEDKTSRRCLVLTDKYITNSSEKKRINRLLQISKNKRISVRIVKDQTSAGKRISQFGGIVLFTARNE